MEAHAHIVGSAGGILLTLSTVNGTTDPRPVPPVLIVPLAFSTPTNRALCDRCSFASFHFPCAGIQSLYKTRRVEMLLSHSVPDIAGTRRALAVPRIRVMVWHVTSSAMSCSAATLQSFDISSFNTANLRCAAQRAWSPLFLVDRSSPLRGYASSSSVERESITMKLVFGGGKFGGGCTKRANKCASVGQVW